MTHKGFAEHTKANGEAVLERKARGKAERPGVTRKGDHLTVTGEAGELADIPEMLRRRKLNPDDWIVERAIVNEWESAAVISGQWVSTTIHQLKIFLKAKSATVIFHTVECTGSKFRPITEKQASTASLIAVLPDQQVAGPGEGYDPALHELVLRWLNHNKPGRVVLSGDLINGTAASRWDKTIRMMASAQPELDAGHRLIEDYRSAVGKDCRIDYLAGNHEAHYLREMRRHLPELADLRPGGSDGPPLFSLESLLGLDKLGVVVAPGEWPHCNVQLSPYLSARHGWIAREKSGASAHKTLDHLGFSVCVGHTHRAGIIYQTKFEIGGRLRVTCAVEAGTLCMVDREGQGYSANPDWQPGFAAFHMNADGTFAPSLASYVNGTLIWEGQRYCTLRGKVKIAA